MKKNIVIGADIGGSHITSAAVDLDNLQIVKDSLFSHKVDNKASKDEILKSWSVAINKTIKSVDFLELIKIGFAIPGPFRYKTGVAMFETNDKYENLFEVSIAEELPRFIDGNDHELRFLNDATSFGVGVAKMGEAKGSKKVIAITLGTGFGSTFINNGIPQVNTPDIPKDGCLWDKPFIAGVADDYFSTRWFIKTYKELSGEEINGVKEISQAKNEYA
ncbi:MAG: ROK family protein, partial [Bacteroidetes bacterium]